MTRDEFERNKRRFGDDVGAWPAPFRQEARTFVTGETDRSPQDDPDRALDRLVLEAALMASDEQALTRKVLARIDASRRSMWSSFLPRFLLEPAGLAACAAAMLVAMTLAGYQVARLQDDLQDSSFWRWLPARGCLTMGCLTIACLAMACPALPPIQQQGRIRFDEAFPVMDGDAGAARPFACRQLLPARLCGSWLAPRIGGGWADHRDRRRLLARGEEGVPQHPPRKPSAHLGGTAELRVARANLAAAQQVSPFDQAAVKDAMAAVRTATTNLQATMQDYLLTALKNVKDQARRRKLMLVGLALPRYRACRRTASCKQELAAYPPNERSRARLARPVADVVSACSCRGWRHCH